MNMARGTAQVYTTGIIVTCGTFDCGVMERLLSILVLEIDANHVEFKYLPLRSSRFGLAYGIMSKSVAPE